MLLGMALAKEGDADKVRELEVTEFMTHSARLAMQAIKDQDKKRFVNIMRRRFGVPVGTDACADLIKHLKKTNAVDAACDATEILLMEIRRRDELVDIAEKWSEALVVLQRAVKELAT